MAQPWETEDADNGINPTTDLPWGVYPDKGSPTGYTHTATGTPVYKDGSPWSGTTSDRTVNVNVAAPVTWGPSQTDDDGKITGVPGAVYQINSRGDVSVISKPKAPGNAPASLYNDTNNDGYDDQSGLPVGVVASSKSPSGFFYQGKPVNADGSLYQGETGNGAPQLVNGKYIWDGTKFVVAPGMETPSSGSANISISGLKSTAGSGGGGSSSSAVSRDYAAEQEASDARSAALQEKLLRLRYELENDPNNPQLILAQQRLQLEAQSLAQRSSEDAAERRLRTIKDFESAVSDTDQAKLTARRLAMGGDVSIANLLRDNPEGFQANDAAAALLAEIRGQGGGAPMPGVAGQFGITQMNPVSQSPSGGTGSAPVGTSAPPAGAPVPGQPPTPMTPVSTGPTLVQRLRQHAEDVAKQEHQAAWDTRNGYFPTSTPSGIVYQEVVNGVPTGKTMTREQFVQYEQQTNPQELGNPSMQEQIRNALQMAQERENQYQQVQDWTQAPRDITAGFNTASGGTDYRDKGTASAANSLATVYRTPWGFSDTNQMPVMPTTGNLENDQIQRGIDLKPQGVLALARGGMAPVGEPAIVGERGPELMLPTPQGTIVRPMHPVQAQGLLEQGTPGYAFGTSDKWARARNASSTTGYGGAPVAPMQPVSTVQAPAQGTVIPYAPPQNNTVPTTQTPLQPVSSVPNNPVTGQPYQAQPMQPVSQPQPQTAGGTTVPTQPAFNPAQPTAVTPESSAYLDEIRRFRDSQNNLQDVNPLDVSFGRLAPTYQQAYYEQMKTRTGIPIEDQLAEQRRYQMAGRGRAMSPLGY